VQSAYITTKKGGSNVKRICKEFLQMPQPVNTSIKKINRSGLRRLDLAGMSYTKTSPIINSSIHDSMTW